jgi:hypothetical protein
MLALSASVSSQTTRLQHQMRQEREASRMGMDLRHLKARFLDQAQRVPIPMTIAEEARGDGYQRILQEREPSSRGAHMLEQQEGALRFQDPLDLGQCPCGIGDRTQHQGDDRTVKGGISTRGSNAS